MVGLLGRGISPTQGLYLHTGQYNTEKRGHASMPRARFEPAIPVCLRPRGHWDRHFVYSKKLHKRFKN